MLVRFNPWSEVARLENQFNSLFGEAKEGLSALDTRGETETVWQPPVDVVEADDKIVLRADLPGVAEKDVDVTIEKNVLTLRATRKSDYKTATRIERRFGVFSRAFTLPPTIDGSQVAAELHDGVLTLTLPKAEITKPRKVQVAAD